VGSSSLTITAVKYKALGIPQCIVHYLYGSTPRGPEDDSLESKHVALLSHYMFSITTVVFDWPDHLYCTNTSGWNTSFKSRIFSCGLPGCTIILARLSEKRLLNIKCVFWYSLQLLSEIFLILRRIQRDIAINVRLSSCKIPVILVRF
jgi:hypothetical protein